MAPTPSANDKTSKATRQRVLESACEVFAEKGFHDATVQDICEHASANIASVNYYFRDKENLYSKAWRYAMQVANEKYSLLSNVPADIPPEEQLYHIFLARLRCIHDEGLAGSFPKLLARELLKPTPMLEEVVLQVLHPQMHRLGDLVAGLIGPGATDRQVRGCTMSIVAQFAHTNFSRPILKVMQGIHEQKGIEYERASVEELARHMTDFSLAGIRYYREQNERRQTDDRAPQ